MKSLFAFVIFSLFTTFQLSAQQLGEFEPKIYKSGVGKLKKVKKRIYITKFNINYEVYKSSKSFSAGGQTIGGGVRGDAEATAAVGLKGIAEADLQEKTDQLYQEYIAMLKQAGLEIISPDEAAKTDAYEGWERLSGGEVNKSQMPGVLTVRPTDFEYFVRKINKKGKEKTGFIDNFPAVSKGLDNALIGVVDMTVMFSENGKQYFKAGGFAKVKIKTNMRLVDNTSITAPKKTIMKGGGTEVINVQSKAGFYFGKVGLASLMTYEGTLKKPMEIDGVIPEDKIKAVAVADRDDRGTDWGVIHVYRADDTSNTNLQVFDIDSKLYTESSYQAIKKLIETTTKGFLENL